MDLKKGDYEKIRDKIDECNRVLLTWECTRINIEHSKNQSMKDAYMIIANENKKIVYSVCKIF